MKSYFYWGSFIQVQGICLPRAIFGKEVQRSSWPNQHSLFSLSLRLDPLFMLRNTVFITYALSAMRNKAVIKCLWPCWLILCQDIIVPFIKLNNLHLTLQTLWNSNTHPNSNKIRVMRELLSQRDCQLISFECSDFPWARDKVHPARNVTKDYMVVATCCYCYMCILAQNKIYHLYKYF